MSSKVPSFHTHIQPQLNEIIADLLSEANPPESYLEPLKGEWWTHRQYKDIPLHYGKAELNVEEWAAAAEALGNQIFIPILKKQIADTIEHQWEIRMQEWDEDTRYQDHLEMEREMVTV